MGESEFEVLFFEPSLGQHAKLIQKYRRWKPLAPDLLLNQFRNIKSRELCL